MALLSKSQCDQVRVRMLSSLGLYVGIFCGSFTATVVIKLYRRWGQIIDIRLYDCMKSCVNEEMTVILLLLSMSFLSLWGVWGFRIKL